MNIKIISVGNLKERYLKEAIKEYLKRLSVYANIQVIEILEEKISRENDSLKNHAMEQEAHRISKHISGYFVALCIEGKNLSSEEFANQIQKLTIDGISDITFLIGGSYGIYEELKKKADLKLSFSKMTFPHQLMRVFLLEQIYRSFKIIKNEPYHK